MGRAQSVENLNFNGYSTGAAADQLIQTNNTYQITDAFSKVFGNHTIKFGAEFHADQVNAHAIAQFNGSFVFSGTETGVDFADFLIGVPANTTRASSTRSTPGTNMSARSLRIAGTFART